VIAATGCSSDTTASNSAAADCTPEHEFDTITAGSLTVGVPTFLPYTQILDGAPSGVDGDIINAFAKAECLDVVATPLDYSGLIPAVQQNRIDVAIGSIYRTVARAEQASVTEPIYLDQMGVISSEGVSSVDDMRGLRVGAIDGNLWVEDLQASLGGDLSLYPSSVELQQDLETGRIDVAIDSYGAASLSYADSDYQVKVIDESDEIAASTNPGQTGFYAAKNAKELTDALDEQITRMKDDGTLADILTTWDLDPTAAETGDSRLI
jgi:polar amino acid transport system substrate-binding protein